MGHPGSAVIGEAPSPRVSYAAALAAALPAAAALLIGRLGLTGVDVPAQVYRLNLFRSAGLIGWDPGWYGGHEVLAYSVVFAPLANVIGLYGAAAAGAGVGAWC